MARVKVQYEIIFLETEIIVKDLERFVHEILYKFNGNSILSNVLINVIETNKFEIICEDEYLFIVHGAFCLTGKFTTHLCCFKEIKS